MRLFLVTVTFLLLVVLVFKWPASIFSNPPEVIINGSLIRVELAESNEQRAKGLSFRQSLPQNKGMLLIFEKSDYHGIWMKDMNFNLDLIWIDNTHKVADLTENIAPESYPEIFRSKTPVNFVLEVNAGFIRRYSIAIGDSVRINY